MGVEVLMNHAMAMSFVSGLAHQCMFEAFLSCSFKSLSYAKYCGSIVFLLDLNDFKNLNFI